MFLSALNMDHSPSTFSTALSCLAERMPRSLQSDVGTNSPGYLQTRNTGKLSDYPKKLPAPDAAGIGGQKGCWLQSNACGL